MVVDGKLAYQHRRLANVGGGAAAASREPGQDTARLLRLMCVQNMANCGSCVLEEYNFYVQLIIMIQVICIAITSRLVTSMQINELVRWMRGRRRWRWWIGEQVGTSRDR